MSEAGAGGAVRHGAIDVGGGDPPAALGEQQVGAQTRVLAWFTALRRRSQRSRLNRERMQRLVAQWLAKPRLLHPWPNVRFDARTRGRSLVH